MPKSKKKPYFGQEQEAAVRVFLTASTYTEKHKAYNDHLRAPLNKMVESIIKYGNNLEDRIIREKFDAKED